MMDRRSIPISEPVVHGCHCVVVDLGHVRHPASLTATAAFCIFLMMTFGGCGNTTHVPVNGQVKIDGKPIAGCAVLFVPAAGGPAASATTDTEGHFELATTNQPGVAVGDYSITITKQHTTDLVDRTTGDHNLRIDWLTPQKYSRPETSGIRKTVSEQNRKFLFELSSK